MSFAGVAFWYAGVRREVSASALRAVIAAPNPTRVPGAHQRVIGVMAWRGTVLTLLRPEAAVADVNCAVVLEANGVLLALGAERVEGYVNSIDPLALIDAAGLLREVSAMCRGSKL